MVPVRRHARDWLTYVAGGGSVLKKEWRLAAFWLTAFLAVIGLFAYSERFQKCIHERKYHKTYNRLHNSGSLVVHSIVRFRLNVACAADDSDVFVVLSGLAVAIFTFTLWRSTHKLWTSAEKQFTAFEVAHTHEVVVAEQNKRLADRQQLTAEKQTVIADTQLQITDLLEKPLLVVQEFGMGRVGYADSDKLIFPEITLRFRNLGRSAAIVTESHVAIVVSSFPPIRVKGHNDYYFTEIGGTLLPRTAYIISRWPDNVLANGDFVPWTSGGTQLIEPQAIGIADGSQKVWLDGFIIDEDTSQRERQTHFRWIYHLETDSMIPEGPAFNYYI